MKKKTARWSGPPWPTFGNCLRAARLCYGWSERHRAFIRMTEVGPGDRFLIEVVGPAALATQKQRGPTKQRHTIWYERDSGDPNEILDACPALVALADQGGLEPEAHEAFYVDGKGVRLP